MERQAEAIALARNEIAKVDRRAKECPEPACRRHRRCTANPYLSRQRSSGGCPMTAPAEWERINLGITLAMRQAFAAVDAARAKTGESFEAAARRMMMAGPANSWQRRHMIRPLREQPGGH